MNTITLPLTKREVNALLHLIAAATSNGQMKPAPAEIEIGSYLSDRIIRLCRDAKFHGSTAREWRLGDPIVSERYR